MKYALPLLCALAWAPAAHSQSDAVTAAAQELSAAAEALSNARRSNDRIAALTATIRAYEKGLASMRDGVRRTNLMERQIQAEFDQTAEQQSKLLGALLGMQTDPETLYLLHPSGPVDTARAGMMLTDLTPAIQKQVDALTAQLEELALIKSLQESARDTLTNGLTGVQTARVELSQAISDRTELPSNISTDDAAMQALINSAETLDGFATSLSGVEDGAISDPNSAFSTQKGQLMYPLDGTLTGQFNDADAAGVRRPGLLISAESRSLVTNPWPATIRYLGPLLDYGNVIILEPEAGYLIVMAGLSEVYGAVGDVVDTDAPLGLMGGTPPDAQQILINATDGGGQTEQETLYLELRKAGIPEDPEPWFAARNE